MTSTGHSGDRVGGDRNRLLRRLEELFSATAGQKIRSSGESFLEMGLDSLVLVQVGIEISKAFGISVPLLELTGRLNSLPALAEHILENAPVRVDAGVRDDASPVEPADPRDFPSQQQKPQVESARDTLPLTDVHRQLVRELSQIDAMLSRQLRELEVVLGGNALLTGSSASDSIGELRAVCTRHGLSQPSPIYFGPPGAPVFGIYHAPRMPARRRSAVLICPPLGFEYLRAQREIATLAEALARAGHHVLRFDYPATGNSPGKVESGQMLRWLRSIDAAIHEIRTESDAEEVTVVGLRLGGLIASTALATGKHKVERLVLWDPVVSGAEYLSARKRIREQLPGPAGPRGDKEEMLLGFACPRDLIRTLQFLDLRQDWQLPARECAVTLLMSEREEFDKIEGLSMSGATSPEVKLIEPPANWNSVGALSEPLPAAQYISEVVAAIGSPAE